MNVDKIIQVRLHRKPVHLASVLREGLHGLQPDLELVGEEGARLGVHSLVLASCSPALATLLATSHSCGQGSVLVPGVGSRELQSTVTLIYHGLVTVAEEDVKLVLETAKLLGIDGIDFTAESQTEYKEDNNSKTFGGMNSEYGVQDCKALERMNLGVCNDDFDMKDESYGSDDFPGGDNEISSVEDTFIKKEGELEETYAAELQIIRFEKKETVKNKDATDSKTCPICQKDLMNSKQMKRHLRRVHSEEWKKRKNISVVCHECGKTYKNALSLFSHRYAEHSGRVVQCDQCDYKCAKASTLRSHIKFRHEKHSFFCDQCNFTTANKQNLDHHVRTVHEGFRVNCSECDYQARSKAALKTHYESIHLTIKHKCPTCLKDYSSRNALRNHCLKAHQQGISTVKTKSN